MHGCGIQIERQAATSALRLKKIGDRVTNRRKNPCDAPRGHYREPGFAVNVAVFHNFDVYGAGFVEFRGLEMRDGRVHEREIAFQAAQDIGHFRHWRCVCSRLL